MKVRRRIPILEAVMKQALSRTFKEIIAVASENGQFYVSLHISADPDKFVEMLSRYVRHLLDEFGEPNAVYQFHLQQNSITKYRLQYCELNNMTMIAV